MNPVPARASLPAAHSAAERCAHELFRTELAAALVELAHHYGFDVMGSDALTEPSALGGHQVAGIIGFAGRGLSGTVAVRAPSSMVRTCLPLDVANPDNHLLGDWIAELTNQLVGRTKNKLIRYRAAFEITPPTYAIADELLVLGCDRPRTSWLAVSTTVGPLLVMLELHTAADFAFAAVQSDDIVAQAEGEMVLF